MNLLLHICCAPCLIYPLGQLRAAGLRVSGLFYNPNIHPFSEFKIRKQAVRDFSQDMDIEINYPRYNPEEFFREIKLKETSPQRCSMCWRLRLKKTAEVAKEKRFAYFSTTLLVSPYQDQTLLKKIGSDIAKEEAVGFYYEDFRCGFREARQKAKLAGIYCQKYCGCIYSQIQKA